MAGTGNRHSISPLNSQQQAIQKGALNDRPMIDARDDANVSVRISVFVPQSAKELALVTLWGMVLFSSLLG